LRQRNRGLLEENARLRAENTRLKHELALAYGQQREARRRS
jgi:regulator of replication initiation timing